MDEYLAVPSPLEDCTAIVAAVHDRDNIDGNIWMLLGGKQSKLKQVGIVTRNPKFNRLLATILAEWKFFAVEDLSAAEIVFIERGLEAPDVPAQIVWLTPLPMSEGSYLQTPLSLTELYHFLEVHFFSTPRRHIRVVIEARAGIMKDGSWQDCQLISMSDRGGRMSCEQEVPMGSLVKVEMTLKGKQLELPAEVLYCVPSGDTHGRSKPQVGLLFKPDDDRIIGSMRRFIEKFSVEAACAKEGLSLNDPCLSWLDLPDDPWVT